MTLLDRLDRLSRLWAATNDRSRARLATIVANDGKLFDRLEAGATLTIAKWEAFLTFFREPANWRDGEIPSAAALLLAEVDHIATEGSAAPQEDAA